MTRTILGLFTLSALAFSQRPTAYAYHNFSPSTTGSTIYAGSSIQGSMSGSFPPDAIRHTYTAGFTIVPPSGSGLSSVPCSVSESGDPSNSYDPQCYQSISGIAIGYYFLNLADSATCSYAGSFYSDSGTSVSTLGFSPIQHTYPSKPLPQACRISSFFDAVRNARAHHAEDVVYDNGKGGSAVPAYGTAVKAMEAGTVIAAPTGYGPASTPYPGCQGAPGNYAKIQGADKYFTIYFHMKPIVGVGPPVSAGQVIGYLDNSGCHRRPPPRGQKRSVGKSRQFYDPLCQHRSNNPVLRWGRGGWRSRQSLTCTTL